MNADERASLEEAWISRLAQCDEALAAGQTPRELLSTTLSDAHLQREVAYLERVRRALELPASPAPASPAPASPALPWISLGRFELLRELGRGGFGIVYLAYDPVLRREVALKVPRAEAAATPQLHERFHREARAASALDHPHVVPIYEVGEIGPVCYIVSAYCPGISLAGWLKQISQPVPFAAAAGLVAVLADAVQHAHGRGIVHRDLKPANILLTTEHSMPGSEQQAGTPLPRETEVAVPPGKAEVVLPLSVPSETGETTIETRSSALASGARPLAAYTPKITDFGLAKVLLEGASEGPTQSGTIVGTAGYMAPEQAAGKSKDIRPAADVYSLGTILYELLTGRPPFRGETEMDTLLQVQFAEPVPPSRLRPKVPRDLETITLRALAKSPGGRYASAQALADDLRRYLRGEPIQARPIRAPERLLLWARRRPAAAVLCGVSAAMLLSLVALIVGLFYHVELQQALASETEARQDAVKARGDEAQERHRAEQARAFADQQKHAAEIARGETQEAFKLATSYLTFHRIGLAYSEWRDNQLDRAEQLLKGCPGDLRGWEWRYVKRLCHTELLTLRGHSDAVKAVVYSPDGKLIASTGFFSGIRVWDASKSTVLRLQPGEGAAFSPDSKRLASVDRVTSNFRESVVKIRDIASGQVVELVGAAGTAAFSPDGKRVATLAGKQDVKVWDASTGKELLTLHGHTDVIRSVAYDAEGKLLATTSDDKTVKLWNAESGQEVRTLEGHERFVVSVMFSPDGKRLASGSVGQTIMVWDTATGQALLRLRGAPSFAFSPDGQRLAAGVPELPAFHPRTGEVTVWNLRSGAEALSFKGHRGAVYSVAFSPDGRRLASGSFDRTVKIWDATDRQEVRNLRAHDQLVWGMAFSSDGQWLASASSDSTVKVWHTATGTEHLTFTGHRGPVHAVAFRPHTTQLVSVSHDRTVRLWDAVTGQESRTFAIPPGVPSHVAFSANGTRLAVGFRPDVKPNQPSRSQQVFLLDADTGTALSSYTGEYRDGFALGPDGHLVALSGSSVRVWDARTGNETPLKAPPHRSFFNPAWSPDGKRLAAGDNDGTVRIWDPASGRELVSFKGGGPRLAFSADGRRLAVMRGRFVTIHDAATGLEMLSLKGPPEAGIGRVAFSPDGRYLATCVWTSLTLWEALGQD